MRKLVAVVAVAAGLVYVVNRSPEVTTTPPDTRFAQHIDGLCEIARAHEDTPVPGIRAFGGYVADHAESMTGAWGALLAEIERISDEEDHDDRAELARQRITRPFLACERDFEAFFMAVDEDPEAAAIVQRAMERLSRTLEIIGGNTLRTMLRDLPPSLRARLLMFYR